MFLWINFVFWTLSNVGVGMMFAIALERRWESLPKWMYALLYTVVILPFSFIKITQADNLWGVFSYFAAIILMFFYVVVSFKDRLWKKFLLFILFHIICFIAEILVLFVATNKGLVMDTSFNSPKMVLLVSADLITIFVMSSVLLAAWLQFVHGQLIIRLFGLFLLLPISQLMIVYYLNGLESRNSSISNLIICIALILSFIADIILLYLIMEQNEKEVLGKRILELESIYRIQEMHYQSVEARREDMAKIRHDFNNQLTTAYNLITHSEESKAKEMLDELKLNIVNTTEYSFCGNAIINSLLTEKMAQCNLYQIPMNTDLKLSERITMKSVHLCSVFSNLLDNAIHAAKDCTPDKRFVSVKAVHTGDYLHVKVENSANDPKKVQKKRTGYGQVILADIVKRYDGEITYDWKNGIYNASISLTLCEEE